MNDRALRTLGLLLLVSACSSSHEKPDTNTGDAGDAADGGTGDGAIGSQDGGGGGGGDGGGDDDSGVIVDDDASLPPPGCQPACALGQRCVQDGAAFSCVNNGCGDLTCTGLEECAPAAGGGNYCKSIACGSDVQCGAARFCDGTKCVEDVCEAGVQHCSDTGNQVISCASNGGAESTRQCVTAAYHQSGCVEGAQGSAGCSCEDDWDCPSFMACNAGSCQGTGVAPTCTLPAQPFADVLPSLEFRWGGASNAAPAADAQSPFPAHTQVSMTPIVANLDDDNGDGFINELDFPEIVFISYSTDIHRNAVVRALHAGGPKRGQHYFARCGAKRWLEGDNLATAASCTDAEGVLRSGSGLAVGDLDNDGVPEIVVATEEGKLQLLDNKGGLIQESAKSFYAYGEASPNVSAWRYPQIALANLDNRDLAEIVVGPRVFALQKAPNGALSFGDVFASPPYADASSVAEGAQGDPDREFGPLVCLANVIDADANDSDVSQEIVVGTALYALPTPPAGVTRRANCAGGDTSDFCQGKLSLLWNARTVNTTVEVPNVEGFCAVADVLGADTAAAPGPENPLDRKPEVILTSNGRMLILNAETGAQLKKIDVEPNQRGGAPNIDDFDGDGFPEIAFASNGFYTVIDLQDPTTMFCPAWPTSLDQAGAPAPGGNPARNPGGNCTGNAECNDGAICVSGQCTCLHNGWRRVTEDDSSKVTSSSVFDFNGDGAAEVVYGDECYFRVYDGASGNVHLAIPSLSRTVLENPVVADVDNDGNAEIVFVNNNETLQCSQTTLTYPDGTTVARSALPNGIQVWGDRKDTWVSARRIWNQHSYHVTNVTEGGKIPLKEPESWRPYGNRIYNTYRSQPRSFGVAPDLTLSAIQVSSPDVACGQLSDMIDISVLVQNIGDLRVGPGVELHFYGETGGVLTPLSGAETHTLTTSLEPGASVLANVSYQAPGGVLPTRVVVRIDEPGQDRPNGAERECRENNNEISGDVSAGDALADLRLDLLDETGSCAAKVVSARIHNDGALAASNVLLRLYAGDPSAGGQVIAEQTIAGPIAPGASVEVNVTVNSVDRVIRVWGVVDPLDTIPECNDVNNVDRGPLLDCGVVVI